jgi:TRAP-type C4-dicarboxylate transport system substrate-binding protein
MNMKKWKSLPYDVQAVMEQVSEEWIPKTGEVWDEMDRRGKKATLKKGNQIVTLSSSEAARWAKAVEPVFESYIESASKKGLPARDYVNFLRKAVKQ